MLCPGGYAIHNALMTNLVRSGILGGMATLAIFLVPLLIFCQALRLPSSTRSADALLGLTFIICQLISSLVNYSP